MRRRASKAKPPREPTIALINIVFLMLIVFLIAGTIALPSETDIELVSLADLEGTAPAETLASYPDGRAVGQGADVMPETFEIPATDGEDRVLRLLPDRNLPAWKLIEIAATLEARGATNLRVVTERTLE